MRRVLITWLLLLPQAGFPAPARLVFWFSQNSYQEAFLKEAVRDFNASHKALIRIESGFELETALLSGTSLKQFPDVILAPSNFVSLVDQIGLSEIPEDLFAPGVDPASRALVTARGKRFGVPVLGGN